MDMSAKAIIPTIIKNPTIHAMTIPAMSPLVRVLLVEVAVVPLELTNETGPVLTVFTPTAAKAGSTTPLVPELNTELTSVLS